MMHGPEKSDLAVVAGKSASNVALRSGPVRGAVSRSGVDGAKGGDQGDAAKHALDSAPGSRDTGAGTHAATACLFGPGWEPYAGARTVLCGGVR